MNEVGLTGKEGNRRGYLERAVKRRGEIEKDRDQERFQEVDKKE